jgi:hypothetical protein
MWSGLCWLLPISKVYGCYNQRMSSTIHAYCFRIPVEHIIQATLRLWVGQGKDVERVPLATPYAQGLWLL